MRKPEVINATDIGFKTPVSQITRKEEADVRKTIPT